MSRLNRIITFACIALSTSAATTRPFGPISGLDAPLNALYDSVSARFAENAWFGDGYQMLDRELFKASMKSYCVLMESPQGKKIKNAAHYGIVNFSTRSKIPRFYIYDVPTQSIIHNIWTTHGGSSRIGVWASLKDTGEPEYEKLTKEVVLSYSENDQASLFSNRSGSLQSSVGMAIADNATYYSQEKGWTALRMNGIDGELNSKIKSRTVVLHEWGFNSDTMKNAYSAPLSEGCPMLPTRGNYQGQSGVEIAKLLMAELLGAPILFYHDRQLTEENDRAYLEQLETLQSLKAELSETLASYAEEYEWSPERKQKYEAIFRSKLEVYDPLIEETHRYFKTRSLFFGLEPKNEAKCRKVLGI